MNKVDPLDLMAQHLGRLPGIGKKSARRLAYHLISRPQSEVDALASALSEGRRAIRLCATCGNYTEQENCAVCMDHKKDKTTICVVKSPREIAAMERLHDYKGVYHVLHGVLSPMDGVGPDDIRIRELMARLADGAVKEVIVATNPDIEGEATASYLARLIKPLGILVTRIAHGVPVGSDLEYADEITLAKALEGRRAL